MSSVLRNYRKIYTTPGADPSMPGRVYNLETNEYKVTYYQVVTGTSGTLTVPSGGTINSNEFGLSGNAILSKVDVNGKPTFESPTTSGGSQVTASLNVLTGAWVASGVYTSSSVALIYSIKIKGIDYHNLVYNNIIETVKVTADVSTINLQSVTDGGSNTTHVIETTGYVKTGGTSSQFLKADGSVDSNTYLTTQVNADWNAVSGAAQILNKPTIPTQVVPAGGTTGQILAKVDDTDYNLEWIENYANYTSVLKHTVKAGEAISKGQAVYVSSADGTNMVVSKASNTSEATSSKTMGLLAQTLATNGKGFVITEGLLTNVNTLGATAGDPVWLGTSGNLIFGLIGKPYAPAHLVFIGIVTRVSATVGEIFVKVQNGFELKEIHDVDLITTAPSNNEILTFESSTSLWKPKTVVSALGFTPYNSTNPSGYITGITSGMVTTALGFTPYDATNPSGYITSSALSTYVPYTGATANVNLGTNTLFTPLVQSSGTLTLNANGGNVVLKSYNATIFTYTTNGFSATPVAASSGFSIAFSLTKPNNTNQTASSNIPGWNYVGGSRQWAAGNITTQTENVWGATTYSFVGASTITNAYGNVFNAPVAGTNATITNNYSAQFNGKVEANLGLETNTLAGLNTAGANLLIVSNNTATKGTITIGNNSAETVYLANQQFGFTNVVFYTASSATGFSISRVTASDTVPNFVTNRSDGTTGIGGTVNTLSLITASTTKVKLFNSGNLTLQNGGTFTDNGYRLEVVGLSRFTDRVAINYPSLSATYKLGVGGSMVVNGQIIVQDDSGVFAAYSSDGLTQSGGFNFNRYVGVNIYSSNTNPIKLSVNGAEALRIFNGGNISIGSTTDAGYKLNVTGTGNFTDRVNIGNYATPSAQRMLTIGQDTAFVSIGSLVGATANSAIYMNVVTPTVNNYSVRSDSNNLFLNCQTSSSSIMFTTGNAATPLRMYGPQNTASVASYVLVKPTYVNGTASTAIAGWSYDGTTRNWLTGNITTQSENVWGATTYSFVAASTITNAYGNVFNAPIAGTNATFSNSYAAQFNGKIQINNSIQFTGVPTSVSDVNGFYGNNTSTTFFATVSPSATLDTTNGAFFVLRGNTYSAAANQRGWAVFASGLVSSPVGAEGCLSFMTGANVEKFRTYPNGNIVIQSGGTFTDNGFKLDVNGTGRFQNTLKVTNNLIAGFNTTPRTGTISDGVTSILGNLQNFTTNYHSGEVLYNEVSGEALNFGQLCYRDAAGKWQRATGSSSTIAAYNMLGICLQTVGAVDTAISILTRGYVESTYLSAGAVGNPLFMDATTAGSITNTAPSTAGNVVRVIGNVFWSSALQTNSKWIVYFNPDNTWIEL